MLYQECAAPALCLVLVTLSVSFIVSSHPQQPITNPSPSLINVLGKEYNLFYPDSYNETLQAWNHSECEISVLQQLWKKPYVIKLTEDSGEFVLTTKREMETFKFQLNKEFPCREEKNVCKATMNGTALIFKMTQNNVTLNITADEIIYTEDTLKSSLILKPRLTKDNSSSSHVDQTRSGVAPSLASASGKEYVLEKSAHNQETFRASGIRVPECIIYFITKYPLLIKLTKNNDEFELNAAYEMYNTRFQLDKEVKDSRGMLSTFSLNGTVLTRVSHSDLDPAPRTSTWRFGPEEMRFQEVVEGSDTSFIFKVRNTTL